MYTFIIAIVQKSKSLDSWYRKQMPKHEDDSRGGNKTGEEADLAATHS